MGNNSWHYTLLLDDIVMTEGDLHALTEAGAEARLLNEVAPKFMYNRYVITQLFCEDCGGDNDVTFYQDGDKRVVKCKPCRFKSAQEAAEGPYCWRNCGKSQKLEKVSEKPLPTQGVVSEAWRCPKCKKDYAAARGLGL